MKTFIQFAVAGLCALGTLVILYLMATSELGFQDESFGKYYGILGVLAAISFIILTQNNDNEETNPAKENTKK